VLIITSLIVECADRVFALPQDSIQRVLRIDLALTPDAVQMASLGETLRMGDRIFPLVVLSRILKLDLPKNHSFSGHSTESNVLSIVILESDGLEYSLVVDRIHDAEEIVVKRINSYFNPTSAFAGATFMGDGSIGLILDVAGLAKLANLDGGRNTGVKQVATPLTALASTEQPASHRSLELLLFKLQGKALFGVPLDQVFRLEELDSSKIKRSGAERVIVYRDRVMPLVAFDHLLNMDSVAEYNSLEDIAETRARIPTIVAQGTDGYFGLVVDRVIDIAGTEAEVSPAIRDRKGIIGNTFIRDHNVTVVDLQVVLDRPISGRNVHRQIGKEA